MCQYVLCLDNENEISDIFTMLSYFMFHNKNKNMNLKYCLQR